MKLSRLMTLILALGAVVVFAQQPATTTAPAAAPAPASDVEQNLQGVLEEPLPGDSYRYDPQGRRDPFRSLIGGTRELGKGERPEGVPGFLIDEIDLQGVFRTREGLTAMISGPDNKGYTLHVGDKVFDGEVIRMTPGSVIFRQEVNDPTQIERYREVTKELTPQAGKN